MSGRVLIVEDEPFIAEALEFILSREGITVTVARDGGAALTMVGGYDLIVLDIMLPGASGFEIAEAAAALSPRPKVCVLSAKGQPADQETMRTIGVDAFVTKPFSNKALMETIKTLLAAP
ncbi:MAG: response regulator transcription factor [Pseudomonadota bacterium]